MRNRMYGGVRGRKTKVGEKLLRFPPTRLIAWVILFFYGKRFYPYYKSPFISFERTFSTFECMFKTYERRFKTYERRFLLSFETNSINGSNRFY